MFKSIKNKKKKGFTLVELIAVIAIIAILAAIIVPMVGKYTTKAKESKGKEELRQYVMAVETAAADLGVDATTVDSFNPLSIPKTVVGTIGEAANKIVPMAGLKNIQTVTFIKAKGIIGGTGTFTVDSAGVVTAS